MRLLTHPEKLLFPKTRISKEDLASYYFQASVHMLPLIRGRPITQVRYPNGITDEGFFQKQAPDALPKWIRRYKAEKKEGGIIEMLLCDKPETLIWLVNQACITPHIWLSRIDKPERPDRLIFDLDPPSPKQFSRVKKAALLLREYLIQEYKLPSYLLTTGSRGLHVMIPLRRNYSFNQVRGFAKKVAEALAKDHPSLLTTQMRKEARKGKIYVDVMRNGYAQTVVAPYAVRAREGAPLALPLFWEELEDPKLRPDGFKLKESASRLKQKQPWQRLTPVNLPAY